MILNAEKGINAALLRKIKRKTFSEEICRKKGKRSLPRTTARI